MIAATEITRTTVAVVNQIRPQADDVDLLPVRDLLGARAHEPGVVEPAEAAEHAEERARREDGREHRDQRPEQEHEREPLDAAGRDREEDGRGDHRHHVRVDDRGEALAVPGRDRRAHGLAGAHLFLDALEDDDVRVGRDADREDDAGDARQGHRHVESEDGAVEEDAVDGEADDGDEAEEAVDEQQEERDGDEAADAGDERLAERVRAERRRDLRRVDLDELDGEGARLEDEREVLRLLDAVEPGDLRAAARDPVREARIGEVDDREGADLVVEHDGEALREGARVVAAAGDSVLRREERAPLGQLPRDVVELVGAVVREVQEDDRLPGLRVEVLASAVPGVEVLAGQRRDRVLGVVRLVLVEVVPGLRRRDAAGAGLGRGGRVVGAGVAPAGEDRLVARDDVELGALGRLASLHLLEELLLRPGRARQPLLLVAVEVPLARRRPLGEVVLGVRSGSSVSLGTGFPFASGGDRLDVGLQVVELELRRLADHLGRALGIDLARDTDDDLVRLLLADLRLGDADLVDTLADDLDGAVEVLVGQLLPRLRPRLEHDLQAALEVEAERRLAEVAERDDGGDGAEEDEQDEEVATHVLGGA